MAMIVRHQITTTLKGDLDEVINAIIPAVPSLGALLSTMSSLTFIVETVAHLQGKEKELLPLCEQARAQLKALGHV